MSGFVEVRIDNLRAAAAESVLNKPTDERDRATCCRLSDKCKPVRSATAVDLLSLGVSRRTLAVLTSGGAESVHLVVRRPLRASLRRCCCVTDQTIECWRGRLSV
jgi:hypothetical protein